LIHAFQLFHALSPANGTCSSSIFDPLSNKNIFYVAAHSIVVIVDAIVVFFSICLRAFQPWADNDQILIMMLMMSIISSSISFSIS